ncbi:MAG: ATP-binding protein [Armatimonadota bacterium]
MILTRLRLQRFGRFRDASWEFAPGLNVIRGPNEAGKSTMREAIVRLLFADRKVDTRDSTFLACTTWGCERHFVLEGELEAAGRRLTLIRDFEAQRIELCLGDDTLTDGGRVRERLSELLEPWSREVYETTACLRQGEFARLDDGERVSELLQQRLAGPGAEAGAQSVIDRLSGRLRDINRGVSSPAKNLGPIASTISRIDELEAEIARLRPIVSAAQDASERLEQLQERREEVERELQQRMRLQERVQRRRELEGELAALTSRCTELERRSRQARELQQRIGLLEEQLEQLPDISPEQAQEARELVHDLEEATQAAKKAEEEAKRFAEDTEQAEKRLVAAREQVPDQALVDRAEELQRAVAGAEADRDVLAEEVEAAEAQRASVERTARRQRLRYLLAVVLVAAGAALGALVEASLALVGLAGIAVFIWAYLSGPRMSAAEARRRYEEARTALEDSQRHLTAIRDELAAALRDVDAPDVDALRARMSKARAAVEDAVQMHARLEGQAQSALAAAQEHRERVERLQIQLQVALKRGEAEDAGELLEQARRVGSTREQLESARAELKGLLGDSTLEELEEAFSAVNADRMGTQKALEAPELAETDLTADEYQTLLSRIEELQAEASELDEETAEVRRAAEHPEADAERLRSCEEQLAAVRRRLERLEEQRDALELARELLDQAHRETVSVAIDVLEPRTGELLSELTCGRYAAVTFDRSTLEPTVHSPQKGAVVDIDAELSCATREQVYLAARLALTSLVWPDERPPILLDDPMVNFDARRRGEAIRIIRRLSQDAQVLLFTCYDVYDDAADRVIELSLD